MYSTSILDNIRADPPPSSPLLSGPLVVLVGKFQRCFLFQMREFGTITTLVLAGLPAALGSWWRGGRESVFLLLYTRFPPVVCLTPIACMRGAKACLF